MTRVLDGIRVLEVAEWVFVPSAGTVLGDWGAEVIKVEHPRFGDPIRGLITGGLIPGASGRNFIVEQLGRNKRSLGLDLTKPAGRELLDRLVARADVFLTSFLDDARERLRLTYEDLRRVNPRLIYARGHGQGQRGPDARRGGYDGVSFWARGGIAAALFRRERTGEGCEVDVSLLGTAMWVLSPDITAALMYGFMLPSSGDMPRAPNPLVGPYVCADGKPIVLMMLQVGRFWPHFVETIGRPDLLERFPDPAPEQSDAIREELARHFATRPREDWSARLRASNCIWGPLQTPLELPDDPQVQANGYLLDAGSVRLCASPVQFGGAPPTVRWPAQETGAATEEVLQELGCSWEEIARWKDA